MILGENNNFAAPLGGVSCTLAGEVLDENNSSIFTSSLATRQHEEGKICSLILGGKNKGTSLGRTEIYK